MRKRTLLAVACLSAGLGMLWQPHVKATGMAVVSRAPGGGTSASTTIVSNAQTHAAGNGLVALIDVIYGGSVSNVSNTAGDTWTQCGPSFDDTGIYNHYEVWQTSNTNGATNDVVTVSLAGNTSYRAVVVYEVSGQETSGMCDTHGTGHGTGTTLTTQSNVVVNGAQDIIFTIGAGLYPPISNGSEDGFNNFNLDGVNNYYFDAYKVVTSSYSPSVTQNASGVWALYSASFMSAGSGSTITQVSRKRGGGPSSASTITSGAQSHTAGNGLLAMIMTYQGPYVTGVSNTAGDTWKQCGSAVDDTTMPIHTEIWATSNSNGNASDDVTVSLSASAAFRTVTVYEVHGQKTSGMCGNASASYGTGTAITSGVVKVTAPQQLIFAVGAGLGPGISHGTWGVTNFTLDGTNYYYFDEYLSVTGSAAALATQASSAAWISSAVGLLPQ